MPSMMFVSPAQRRSRLAGALWGAAIGDALGAAFEFVSSAAIERELRSPMVEAFYPATRGSLLAPRAPGLPTDDTAMALSVARTIARSPSPSASDFAERFLTDLDEGTGDFGDMFWNGGPGVATMGALRRLRDGADPATCGGRDDGGNGSAMRAHPVGFLRDRENVLRVAAVQSRVTHGHPAAVAAAQAVSVLVHDAIAGRPASIACPVGIDEPEFVATWDAAHRSTALLEGRLPAHLRDVEMAGWQTVAAAHAISLCFPTGDFRAVFAAAGSGRDTDTVASIAGAIVGARIGIDAIDVGLRKNFKAREAVDAVIGEFDDEKYLNIPA